MKLVKIGSIIKSECEKQRINIMWDGECLCLSSGEKISDGQAETLEEARKVALALWGGSQCWQYAPAVRYNSLGVLVLENRPRYIRAGR